MKVVAPIEGTVEWRVAPGAEVTEGAVLAWIAGPGRCGLIPILANATGPLRWRRSGALETIAKGELAALIAGDAEELRECLEAERRAIEPVINALEDEVKQLESDERTRPLAAELLRPQRKGVEARLSVLRALRETK